MNTGAFTPMHTNGLDLDFGANSHPRGPEVGAKASTQPQPQPWYQNWDGTDSPPFRGNMIPNLRRDDPAKAQPTEVWDARVAIYDTTKETDMKAYREVFDNIAKGVAIFSNERVEWVPENKGWLIMLRWVERWNEMKEFTRSRFQPGVG